LLLGITLLTARVIPETIIPQAYIFTGGTGLTRYNATNGIINSSLLFNAWNGTSGSPVTQAPTAIELELNPEHNNNGLAYVELRELRFSGPGR